MLFQNGDGSSTTKFIDCYRQGAFVLENKKVRADVKSRSFDDAMLRAHGQAVAYVRQLPTGEGRPPFVVVVDVGNIIELYSEFSQTGGAYIPFPDPRSYRILFAALEAFVNKPPYQPCAIACQAGSTRQLYDTDFAGTVPYLKAA